MREIFFNSFKEKILRGEVDSHIIASGIPMSNEFLDTYDTDDISIEQYRNLEDFNRFSKGNGAKGFEKTKFKYDTFGVDYQNYYEDELSEKPIFVNSDNSAKFLNVYGNELLYNNTYVKNKIDKYLASDDLNINSGFYYVTKKSHLNWIAKRVNDDYNFNNRIVVVLGDDIGTSNEISGTAFESVIGANPDKPFQGIFDLNGHAVNNLNLRCKNNSNGIIGYLGTDGIVRDGVVLNPKFTGMNKISLEKIKNDCSDVVCGTLVGTNYGTVENIVTSGTMELFNGFCPEVYVAGNKSEYQDGMNTYEENNYTNAFFPSKFCINSIYNVIPYVGYFCEGADSYFNDLGSPLIYRTGETLDKWKSLTSACVNSQIGMEYGYQYNLDHYIEGKLSNNRHCDLSSVELTKVIPEANKNGGINFINTGSIFGLRETIWHGMYPKEGPGNRYLADIYRTLTDSQGDQIIYYRPLITMSNDQVLPDKLMKNTVKSIENFIDFEGNKQWGGLNKDLDYEYEYSDYAANIAHQIRDQIMIFYEGQGSSHINTHQKMNPYSRIAYYLSPIVGNNFGTISNIDCRHAIKVSDYTFVGFIGNICGKENCGNISNCQVNLDIIDTVASASLFTSASNADENLDVRQYADTNNYLPDYANMNSGYSNMVNIFGYNYDYFQTSAGLDESELERYSAVSADCVNVSRRFYEYHDLCYSGVWGDNANSFIYNRDELQHLAGGSKKVGNSNFRIYSDSKPEDIGNAIPESIRNAKMLLNVEPALAEGSPENVNSYKLVVRYYEAEEFNKRATYKVYNPYHRGILDNYHSTIGYFNLDVGDLPHLGGRIGHLDINYLGDAAKCVSTADIWDGESITVGDILSYCPDFKDNGFGSTLSNAQDLCRNLMSAKVALGYDMLGNQDFDVSYTYPDYKYPYGSNKGFFGATNADKEFIIPPYTGPNDSDSDMSIGDNLVDMVWYMPPASNVYGGDGPEAYKTGVNVFGIGNGLVNVDACNPGTFCSIQPYGLWDLYGKPVNNDAKLFDDNRNASRPSIQRTMLTIDPLYDTGATPLLKSILSKDLRLKNLLNRSNPDKTEIDYKYRLNKIYIPMANRTQHGAYQSSAFQGESNVSGIFITDYGAKCLINNNQPKTEITQDDIGNLDFMYLDCSIAVPVSNFRTENPENDSNYQEEDIADPEIERWHTYPVIVQIPIQKVLIPISCVTAGSVHSTSIGQRPNQRLNVMESIDFPVPERYVRMYHLTPAYDILERSNSTVQYRLRSIYNIGGIAGMINHSEKYIETENGQAGLGPNWAECGKIENCKINITQRTNQFVQDLQSTIEQDIGISTYKKPFGDTDPRTIGITNKIGGVAAIYEYRQNDMGTSPINAAGRIDVSTDGLMRIRCQKFYFKNISIGGEENVYGYNNYSPGDPGYNQLQRYLEKRTNNRIFSPFIHWCNISNMIDTTNFFGYKESYGFSEGKYLAHHSSNFPIDGNPQLYTAWMEAVGDTIGNGEESPKPLVSQMDMSMLSSAYPFPNPSWQGDDHNYNTDLRYQAYAEPMQRYGSTSAENDWNPYGGFGAHGWEVYPRIGWHKHYEWIPSFLLQCNDVYLYGTKYWNKIYLSMTPMANSPCSDYNDVYLQMFSGNPNFVNRRLSMPVLSAGVNVNFSEEEALWRTSYKSLVHRNVCDQILDIYNRRGDRFRDKYFTWDYETSGTNRDPLSFDIIYKKPKGHSRGLWIHQLGTYDEYEVLRYSMKGGSYGKNDGSCLHLGYLPSDKAVVELLNYDAFNTNEMPRDKDGSVNQFEEGHAISGYGFNGMLIFERSTNDLICYLDTEDSRDFDLGCWVAPMSEKAKIEDSQYGLLTEIVAENSPAVEQDPNDDTKVEVSRIPETESGRNESRSDTGTTPA